MNVLNQPRVAFDILAAKLNDAGVPVESVSGNVGAVEVAYAPFATQAQRDQGAAIVAAFDWTLADAVRESERQAIRDQLAANDATRGIRAISEALAGNPAWLAALQADQAALRALLR